MHSAQHKALHRHLEGLRQSEGEGGGVVVRGEDVRGALREVRPSAMREVTVEVPKVRCLHNRVASVVMCCIIHRCCGLTLEVRKR